MAGINLAEINAFKHNSPKGILVEKVCPRQSDIIFCSNPNCHSMPLTADRLTLLEQGWKIINDIWYCPRCPMEKEKNEKNNLNLSRI